MAVPGHGLFHDSEDPRRVLLTTVPVWFLIPPELFLCMQLLHPKKKTRTKASLLMSFVLTFRHCLPVKDATF